MTYIQQRVHSIIFRIGIVIILAEMAVLAVVGFIYIARFSNQVDRRITAQVQIPGKLMRAGLLSYNSVNDRETIQQLIGEEIVEALVVGVSKNVFFSPDPADRGQSVASLSGVDAAVFDVSISQDVVIFEGANVVSLSPIFGPDGTTLRMFLYIKAGTGEAEAEKTAMLRLFLFGSIATVVLTSVIIIVSFRFMVVAKITRILHALQRVEDGDLNANVEGTIADDEIGHLAKSFAYMRDSIREKMSDLAEKNTELVVQISERRKTEEILQEERTFINSAIDALPDTFFVFEPETGKAVRWNAAFRHISGYSDEEIAELPAPASYYSPEDLAKAAKATERVFEEGRATVELQILTKSGEAIPTEYIASSLNDHQGNLRYLIAVGRDIRERKKNEEELKKHREHLEELVKERTAELAEAKEQALEAKDAALEAQRASEAANKAKSIFLANMSHELRTPLNAILGFARLLNRDPSLSTTQQENLRIIDRSGEHLLMLINDILEISKIEAGRIHVEPQPFDLSGLLQDVIDMMRPRATQKGFALHLEQSPDIPQYIKADAAKLRQILINLLSNAVKFTEKGEVKLRVSELDELDEMVTQQLSNSQTQQLTNSTTHKLTNSQTHKLFFEISDTGIGIAPDALERIFLPFEQIFTSNMTQGTGLGLTITRQYVTLMGGELRVESTVGNGATFSFTIPIEYVDQTSSIKLQASTPKRVVGLKPEQYAADGTPFRILIVEDQEENRLLLKQFLEYIGFDVREALNGQEALDLFHTWHPHFIWMDMRMPVMDGYEATKRIRALGTGHSVLGREHSAPSTQHPVPSTQYPVIVALTASSFEEERTKILEVGCDDFVRKPFQEHEVLEVMKKYLGVQYMYEEKADDKKQTLAVPSSGSPLSLHALAALPSNMRDTLEHALLLGDKSLIDSSLKSVRTVDVSLADAITSDVENFAYGEIMHALRDVKTLVQEGETTSLTTLTTLPAELLGRLEQAIERLHTKTIHDIIETIREYNNALADELDALMYQFDYDTIADWIQQTREKTDE